MAFGLFDVSSFENELEIIKKKYGGAAGMRYGWKANSGADYDQGHWNRRILNDFKGWEYDHGAMPMINHHPEVRFLWENIQQVLGPRTLVRAYCNGYTYGTDGYIHTDDSETIRKYGEGAISETVIVYLNNEWKMDWGGETIVLGEGEAAGDIEVSIIPKYGRTFVFDSHRQHAARPLSRACSELRQIIVFKTASDQINNSKIHFLLDKTSDADHSGGKADGSTLFEHLWHSAQVAKIICGNNIEEWEAVTDATLFHSIYGTDYYKGNTHKVSKSNVRELIGPEAEELVQEFCSTKNRTPAIIKNEKGWEDRMHRNLLIMECANLIDQSPWYSWNSPQKSRLETIAKTLEMVYGVKVPGIDKSDFMYIYPTPYWS